MQPVKSAAVVAKKDQHCWLPSLIWGQVQCAHLNCTCDKLTIVWPGVLHGTPPKLLLTFQLQKILQLKQLLVLLPVQVLRCHTRLLTGVLVTL